MHDCETLLQFRATLAIQDYPQQDKEALHLKRNKVVSRSLGGLGEGVVEMEGSLISLALLLFGNWHFIFL